MITVAQPGHQKLTFRGVRTVANNRSPKRVKSILNLFVGPGNAANKQISSSEP